MKQAAITFFSTVPFQNRFKHEARFFNQQDRCIFVLHVTLQTYVTIEYSEMFLSCLLFILSTELLDKNLPSLGRFHILCFNKQLCLTVPHFL